MAGPLEQFEIKPIIDITVGGVDASFTNSSLWMMFGVGATFALLYYGMAGRALVPSRMQCFAEMIYEFVSNLLRENGGEQARPYFPAVFTLFMLVLMGNLLGMIPYSFTYTSHIIVTFGLAATVFVAVTVIALMRHGLHFFSYFVPKGVPPVMAVIVVPIEIISYLSRPVSLSIRLFANMMAGHTMLKVFAGFSVSMAGALGAVGVIFGIVPLIINVALVGFEILVALLQAYVFTILTCLYLRDAIELH